jgi:hypothetical protein
MPGRNLLPYASRDLIHQTHTQENVIARSAAMRQSHICRDLMLDSRFFLYILMVDIFTHQKRKFLQILKGGDSMFKRIFVSLLLIFLIVFLFCPVIATVNKIYEFKGIQIPFNLKCGDSIIEKGEYNFEILVQPSTQMFHLRIKKKRKSICMVSGERLEYKSRGWDLMKDPKIPIKPTLRIKKDPIENVVYIIFESGKKTFRYPLEKIRFKMKYE